VDSKPDSLTSCVLLDKLLNFTVPQLHLLNGNNKIPTALDFED
jgi:hypothetical protein